jgi:hypothetical protein
MEVPREVWFRRVTRWRSVPVHWKGFALLLACVGIVVPAFYAGQALSGQSSALAGVCFALAIVAFVTFFLLAERHTAG